MGQNHANEVKEKEEFEDVDLEVVSNEERSNEEDAKEVLDIETLNVEAVKKSSKNDTPIAAEINYHNVKEL